MMDNQEAVSEMLDALESEHTFSMGFAVREGARQVGQLEPHRPWIITPFDTWEPNPFYSGPPVAHPEDDSDEPALIMPMQAYCGSRFSSAPISTSDNDDLPF